MKCYHELFMVKHVQLILSRWAIAYAFFSVLFIVQDRQDSVSGKWLNIAFTLLIQCVCTVPHALCVMQFPLSKHSSFCIFLLSAQVFKKHFNPIKAVELLLNIYRDWTSGWLSSALLQVLQMRQCVVPCQGAHEEGAWHRGMDPVAAWNQGSEPSRGRDARCFGEAKALPVVLSTAGVGET